MEIRRLIFINLCIIGYWTILLFGKTNSAKEFFRDYSCGDELLSLDCGNHSVIAIHQAYFTRDIGDFTNMTCDSLTDQSNFTNEGENIYDHEDFIALNNSVHCYEDLRISINRRCSGMNQCNYSYTEEAERSCESSGGAIIIKYDCVRDANLHKYCNTRIQFKEGYIVSPGYPSYYPGLKECNWTVEAADGEIIGLQLLHVNMRPPRLVYTEKPIFPIEMASSRPVMQCDIDSLNIFEGSSEKFSICGETVKELKSIDLAASKGAIIKFKSREFFPASGFLIHYKVRGCPTLSPPSYGKMAYRNGSEAFYFCNEGRVFNDTLEPNKTLQCINEHRWNDTTLSPCINPEDIIKQVFSNQTLNELRSIEEENITTREWPSVPPAIFELSQSYIEDFLVPSILVGIIIIANIIIVVIIFVYRRRQRKKPDDFDAAITNPKSRPLIEEATDV